MWKMMPPDAVLILTIAPLALAVTCTCLGPPLALHMLPGVSVQAAHSCPPSPVITMGTDTSSTHATASCFVPTWPEARGIPCPVGLWQVREGAECSSSSQNRNPECGMSWIRVGYNCSPQEAGRGHSQECWHKPAKGTFRTMSCHDHYITVGGEWGGEWLRRTGLHIGQWEHGTVYPLLCIFFLWVLLPLFSSSFVVLIICLYPSPWVLPFSFDWPPHPIVGRGVSEGPCRFLASHG